MREVILDTETTGLDPRLGHRVVEIGCLELVNHVPTGKTWHCYLNPERAMPADAVAVHGEFLADKQLFADVADELLAFVGDAPLLLSLNCGRIVEQSPQEIFVFVALNQSSAVRTRTDCSKPPIFSLV